MTKIGFKESQQLQYEMLTEFDKFCREHHLTYYLAYGTLLGAVRHGGFIPWDDDIDILMPQHDLYKFIEIYQSDKYSAINCRNNKEHNYGFGRLYHNGTFNQIGKHQGLGVFLDIYGLYGFPNNRKEQLIMIKKIKRYSCIKDILRRSCNFLARKGLWPHKHLDFPLLNMISRHHLKLLEKYDYNDADLVLCAGDTIILPKELLGEPIDIQFERGIFWAPRKYDEILTRWYGNYMQLPPIEKRIPYHGGCFYWK